MMILIRPIADPRRQVDVTRCLVSAIAQELWRLYGGNDQLNWIEAERHLGRIFGARRSGGWNAPRPRLRTLARGTGGRSAHSSPKAAPVIDRMFRTPRRGRGGSALPIVAPAAGGRWATSARSCVDTLGRKGRARRTATAATAG